MGYTTGFHKKEVKDYIDAAGLATDSNFDIAGLYSPEIARQAINTFINSCITSPREGGESLWDKLLAVYLFPTGTASGSTYNAKDPSKFSISYSGTFEHSGYGMRGAGLERGYANIGLVPANDLSIDKGASIFFYTNTLNTQTNNAFGCTNYPAPYRHFQWLDKETYFNFYFGTKTAQSTRAASRMGLAGFGLKHSISSGYCIDNHVVHHSFLENTSQISTDNLPTTTVSIVSRHDNSLYNYLFTGRFGIYIIANYIPLELVPALRYYIMTFLRTLHRQI